MYAVLADVHANLSALESVFADIRKKEIRDVLFAGDAVGYGPAPNECLRQLQDTCRVRIAGNHDRGACGLMDTLFFNEHARDAIAWTRKVLSSENLEVLTDLPFKGETDDATLVHATPREPEKWHYLLTLPDAEKNFPFFETPLCFIGHSHRPVIIEKAPSGEVLAHKREVLIKPGSRYIVNAGSVGQPRDSDPRACYAVVDGEKIEIVRVAYDIKATQAEMGRAGLPVFLIERLAWGM